MKGSKDLNYKNNPMQIPRSFANHSGNTLKVQLSAGHNVNVVIIFGALPLAQNRVQANKRDEISCNLPKNFPNN